MENTKEILESVSSEIIPDEVKEKIEVMIEAKVAEKITEEKEALLEENEIEITEQKEKIIDKLDEYLELSADKFMDENSIAIENGIKTQMLEDLVVDMKTILEKYNVVISDESSSAFDEKVQETDDLRKELNEQIQENIRIKSEMKQDQIMRIFNESTKGLSEDKKEKLKELAGEFDIDDKVQFESKLQTLQKALFEENTVTKEKALKIFDESVEGLNESQIEKIKLIAEDFDIDDENIFKTKLSAIKDLINEGNEETKEFKNKLLKEKVLGIFEEVTEGLSDSQKSKVKIIAGDFDVDDTESFQEKLVTLKETLFEESEDEIKEKIMGIFNTVTEKLTESQKEKVKTLAEDYDITDAKEFKSKVETLTEALYSKSSNVYLDGTTTDDTITEGADFGPEGQFKVNVDDSVESSKDFLSKNLKTSIEYL